MTDANTPCSCCVKHGCACVTQPATERCCNDCPCGDDCRCEAGCACPTRCQGS